LSANSYFLLHWENCKLLAILDSIFIKIFLKELLSIYNISKIRIETTFKQHIFSDYASNWLCRSKNMYLHSTKTIQHLSFFLFTLRETEEDKWIFLTKSVIHFLNSILPKFETHCNRLTLPTTFRKSKTSLFYERYWFCSSSKELNFPAFLHLETSHLENIFGV
jgi:hypothetical protein